MSHRESTWYSGPAAPSTVAAYLDWLIDEHNGGLVEVGYSRGADAYHVEVTALKEQPDGTYRAISGANVGQDEQETEGER